MKKLIGLSVSILLALMFLLVACNTNTYFYPEEQSLLSEWVRTRETCRPGRLFFRPSWIKLEYRHALGLTTITSQNDTSEGLFPS